MPVILFANVDTPAHDGSSPLLVAAEYGFISVVRLLLVSQASAEENQHSEPLEAQKSRPLWAKSADGEQLPKP